MQCKIYLPPGLTIDTAATYERRGPRRIWRTGITRVEAFRESAVWSSPPRCCSSGRPRDRRWRIFGTRL